jgi:hypothetical protein
MKLAEKAFMLENGHFSALPITIVRERGGTMSKMPMPIKPKGTRFFDLLGLVAWICAAPTALFICGYQEPAQFFEKSLGAFGKPIILLLVFLALILLRMLFGSSRRALPILAGLVVGFACFATIYDIPWLSELRAFAARFPAFAEPGPAFFAGLVAIAAGSILGQFEAGKSWIKVLIPIGLAVATILALAGLKPFPAIAKDELSLDSALSTIASAVGYEYRNPAVEAAVQKVIEAEGKTLAEKEKEIAALTERLRQAEIDQKALVAAASDATHLGSELVATKKALEDMKGRLNKAEPLLKGGSYAEAVQPFEPTVRDFAVGFAKTAPGPYDDPQGSSRPTATGLRQAALVHSAIASSWKYVSDPGTDWREYVSPARRSLAVGLAGDCDDFAVLLASCVGAVGGKLRIMNGFTSTSGHAWAELWLGEGRSAQLALSTMATIVGKAASALATETDSQGATWLILDWRLGELSIRPDRVTAVWASGR